jgi:hypothetical protein
MRHNIASSCFALNTRSKPVSPDGLFFRSDMHTVISNTIHCLPDCRHILLMAGGLSECLLEVYLSALS